MSFPNVINGDFGVQQEVGTVKKHTLGTTLRLPDSRVYKYCLANGAITAGKLTSGGSNLTIAAHDMDLLTTTAAAIGDKTYTVTLGATLATENQYQDGYLYVNDGTGEGQIFAIESHPAADASASLTVTFAGSEAVTTATVATTSLCGLIPNPYGDVELFDNDDIDGPPIGVPNVDVADNEFFWCQGWGYAAVLLGSASGLGVPLGADLGGVDGSLTLADVSGDQDTVSAQIAWGAGVNAADTDYGFVFLTISQ